MLKSCDLYLIGSFSSSYLDLLLLFSQMNFLNSPCLLYTSSAVSLNEASFLCINSAHLSAQLALLWYSPPLELVCLFLLLFKLILLYDAPHFQHKLAHLNEALQPKHLKLFNFYFFEHFRLWVWPFLALVFLTLLIKQALLDQAWATSWDLKSLDFWT